MHHRQLLLSSQEKGTFIPFPWVRKLVLFLILRWLRSQHRIEEFCVRPQGPTWHSGSTRHVCSHWSRQFLWCFLPAFSQLRPPSHFSSCPHLLLCSLTLLVPGRMDSMGSMGMQSQCWSWPNAGSHWASYSGKGSQRYLYASGKPVCRALTWTLLLSCHL